MTYTQEQQAEIDFQEKCKKFWDRQRAICQTLLVEMLMRTGVEGFCPEDTENYYKSDEDCEPREILEWWEVDEHFGKILAYKNEPVLSNEYGCWWGRCTSGQAVYMDPVIRHLVRENEKYFGELEKKWATKENQ